jgi:RimJ/RimL family protein N-acetyltransferase
MAALQMTSGSPDTTSSLALESERLVLRAPRMSDADAVVRLANNRSIAEMTSMIPYPYGRNDAEVWINTLAIDTGDITLAITLKENGTLVGTCGYSRRGDPTPELGYWVGEPYWNHGYATEAVQAVIDYAFANAGLEAITSSCRVVNAASRRVLEKCGFQWTGAGLLRVRSLKASVPVDRFRLEQRTWEALRAWGRSRLPQSSQSA